MSRDRNKTKVYVFVMVLLGAGSDASDTSIESSFFFPPSRFPGMKEKEAYSLALRDFWPPTESSKREEKGTGGGRVGRLGPK